MHTFKAILASLVFALVLPVAAQTATHVPRDGSSYNGQISPGNMQVYTVDALFKENLWVYLRSSNKTANFEIMNPDNQLVARGKLDPYGYRKMLVEGCYTGTYTVVLFSEQGIANYELTIQAR
ncbi:MAG: hypothetical protein KC800_08210 [Candidatus Eremiobacteraeota bacterium]|nr:hypothetical protein [Candidatus Eremiobacteraeota bacterium]